GWGEPRIVRARGDVAVWDVGVQQQIDAGQVVRLDVTPAPPTREWYAILPARRPSPAARTLAEFLSGS
ncbi:MAG: hypothetical protein ACKOSO_03120, partial [Actinomycetota bacterium]